uniref:DUF1653 domain-containing protein n=1 Tax=Macrostomum lignano TaxID=282301 RepID=A0A1I8IIE1_9PLAT
MPIEGGLVYIYEAESMDKKRDWHVDEYQWTCAGGDKLPRTAHVKLVRKFKFQFIDMLEQNVNFWRNGYHLIRPDGSIDEK